MLFTFSSRYWFTIGHSESIWPCGMVFPDCDGISHVPPCSGSTQEGTKMFDYKAVTSYSGPFQTSSSTSFFCNSYRVSYKLQEASLLVWVNPVSLAATQGIAFAFYSCGYLISVPGSAFSYPMSSKWMPLHYEWWVCPIRKSPDQSLLTAPQSISVFVPSFIGS